MPENPYLDTPVDEPIRRWVLCAIDATLWGAAGFLVTACVGGVGFVPAAVYGWYRRSYILRHQDDAIRRPDGTIHVRDVLARHDIDMWEARWAAENDAPRDRQKPKLPPMTEDELYLGLTSLGYSAAEAKAVIPLVPAQGEEPIEVRLRLALREFNKRRRDR